MKFSVGLIIVGFLLTDASAAFIKNDLIARDGKGYVELDIFSEGYWGHDFPYLEFSVGSPPQVVRGLIDTGSPLFWFKSSDQVKSGYFDPKASNTSKFINDDFTGGYMVGTVEGSTYEDQVILDATIPVPLTFGVSKQFTTADAVFGISPANDHPAWSLPISLKESGVIKSTSYSFIGNPDSSNFTLIFGGIDHNRYEGELKFLPWSKNRTFALDMDYVEVKGTKIPANVPVVFDTGTTFFQLEPRVYDQIVEVLDGGILNGHEVAFGDGKRCEELDFKTLGFSFANGEAVINISTEPFIYFKDEVQQCVILMSSNTANLFPTNAMHGTYLAWNNDNNTIAVADVKRATTKNIQPIL